MMAARATTSIHGGENVGVTLTFNYGGCLSDVSVTKSFRTRKEMERYLRCFDYIPGKAVLCSRVGARRKPRVLDYVGTQNTPLLLGSIEIGE